MPPEMKRQNAFSEEQPEPFRDIACRICYQSEACGVWKRITCQCSIMHDYYHSHEFCLQRVKRCKICQTPFIEQKPINRTTKDKVKAFLKPHVQHAQELLFKYKYQITISLIIGICILFSYDLYRCTTIEKVDQNDLPDLTTNEYLWLPVFDVKCFKSGPSSYLVDHIFNFYFIFISCISFIYYQMK